MLKYKKSKKRSGIPTSILPFYLRNYARTNHIWWPHHSNRFTGSTNNRHWNQSSTDLGTQASSSTPFSPTGSPSQCIEALESIWRVNNLSEQLLPEAGKPQNGQMVFQRLDPPAFNHKILQFLHSDHTSNHPRFTKTFEKVRPRFSWPGPKIQFKIDIDGLPVSVLTLRC